MKPSTIIKFIIPVAMIATLHLSCDKTLGDSGAKPGANVNTGIGGSLARFTIAGSYLYTVDNTTLKVYSLANPAAPAFTSSTDVGFEIETIYPFQDKLFIGSTSVIHIFSITDPAHPEKLSTAISPEVLRRCDPVVAKENVAYATLRTNGPCGGVQSIVAVYDISDILHPVQVQTLPASEPYGLGYKDSALYVCDRFRLQIFNISNPLVAVPAGEVNDGEYIDVIPYDNTLVCWMRDGVAIYDISERFAPKLVTKIM